MVHFIVESRDGDQWRMIHSIEARNIHQALDVLERMLPPEIHPADWRIKPSTREILDAIVDDFANDPRD